MYHVFDGEEQGEFLKAETRVLCGIQIRRCAITLEKFKQYTNAGKLNDERCCKVCKRAAERQI